MKKQFAFLVFLLAISFSHAQTVTLPKIRTSAAPFIWGVNGHPFTQEAYTSQSTNPVLFNLTEWKASIDKQLDYVGKLGASYYRIDLEQDATTKNIKFALFNNFVNPSADNTLIALDYLYTQATVKEIKLLPVLVSSPDYAITTTQSAAEIVNYNKAYDLASYFGTKYGHYFDYYEIANELDNEVIRFTDGSAHSGFLSSDYRESEYKIATAYLAGLNAGIKYGCSQNIHRPANSPVKTIVNIASSFHFTFLQLITSYQFQKSATTTGSFTDFDIIGLHLYSDQGEYSPIAYPNNVITGMLTYNSGSSPVDILAALKTAAPNKDIWITEFNTVKYGSNPDILTSNDKIWLADNIKILYNDEKVKAIFIHELYNQQAQASSPKVEESKYGLITCDSLTCMPNKPFAYQDEFNFFKLQIEKYNYGYEDIVRAWYVDLACRLGSDINVNTWKNNLINLYNKNAYNTAIAMLNEPEMAELYVTNAYKSLFDRDPDGSGLTTFKTMYSNQNWEDVIVNLCISSEMWCRSNAPLATTSTGTKYVDRLYLKLLGRQRYSNETGILNDLCTNIGINTYTTGNPNPTPAKRTTAVNAILDSQEYLDQFINAEYNAYLNRDAYTSEKNYWRPMLQSTLTQKSFVTFLISSDEYFENAIKLGYVLRYPDAGLSANVVDNSVIPGYIYNKSCKYTVGGNSYRQDNNQVSGISNLSKIKLYPNPVNGILQIDSELNWIEKIEIFSMEGKIIKSITPENKTAALAINMDDIKSGFYLCSVKTAQGVSVLKFLKR